MVLEYCQFVTMCFQIKELKIHENTYFRLESEKKIIKVYQTNYFSRKCLFCHPPPHNRIRQRTKDRKLSAKARLIRFLVVRHRQY